MTAVPVYRTIANAAAAGSSPGVTAPAGRVAGDVLIASLSTSAAPTTPSGWTLIRSVAYRGTVDYLSVYWRVADGTSNDNFTTSAPGSSLWVLSIAAYSLPTTTATPILAYADAGAVTVSPYVVALTPSQDVLLVAAETARASGSVTTTNAAMTKRLDTATVRSMSVWDASAAGGVSASESFSSSSSVEGTAILIALRSNTPPNAPTGLSPAGATTINRANSRRFSWLFNDPDTGDTQSKFDLQYRVGTGTWTTVTGSGGNPFYDMPAGTLAAANYEWQVRTYDRQGLVSPWSASAFFTAADAPGVPTITAPIDGDTISTNTGTLDWSTPSQQAYRVRKVADDGTGLPDTATVYYDSGEVVSSTARSAGLTFPVNGRPEHLQLQVEDAGLWSAWASVRVTVSFTPPPAPDLYVNPADSTASILVTPVLTAPSGGEPTIITLDVRRRETSDTGDGIRIATGLAPSAAWSDRTPASGVDYAYQLVAVGDNGTSSSSPWTSADAGFFGDTFTSSF